MKQKVRQLGKIRARWRILAIAVLVLGALVPVAMAASNEWWGTANGDFRDTPQDNNYVIHPPADQLPQSAPGGSDDDGARLSFVINNSTTSAGTTLAYIPNQFFVTSTTANLTFEMRGGVSGAIDGARDRYDKDSANPGWIIDDFIKKRGFLSPVYYEVYQLKTAGPQDGTPAAGTGRLLGIINPRDRDVFPTTDNGPNTNTECKYVSNSNLAGPCWRTFSINKAGDPLNSGNIVNRITLGTDANNNPSQQDSCASRFNGSNFCYDVRRDNDKTHVHEADNVWVVRQNNDQKHAHGDGDTPHSHHNPTQDPPTGDTSQLNRNDNAHDQFNTHPEGTQTPGNCFWEWLADTDFNGNDDGSTHRHRVFCGQFENNVQVGYGGAHSHPDGSGETAAIPGQPYPGEYSLGSDKLQHYNRSAGNYEDGGNCFWSWLGDFPDGDNNHTHAVYCYDKKASDGQAVNGVAMNSGTFQQIDGSDNGRFNSSLYPNLNGDYVFLIKMVNYQDLGNGYVTNYGHIIPKGNVYGGCAESPVDGNIIKCPNQLLDAAVSRGVRGNLVQDGYFLRTPREVAGGKSFLASSPNRLSFGLNYGPVGGVNAEPGEDNEYEEMAGQSYGGLRFQAGGAACRTDPWAYRGPGGDTTVNPQFKIGNADWDSSLDQAPGEGGFEGGTPAGDENITAAINRLGTMSESNVLNTNGYNPPTGITRTVAPFSISGTWRQYPGWSINLDSPLGQSGSPNGEYNPKWRQNETLTGRVDINHWNDGNILYQGGAPLTWGYWPTCLRDDNKPDVNLLTPKDGYTYDGTNSDNPIDSDGNTLTTSPTQPYEFVNGYLNFKFNYDMKETRGTVRYQTELATDPGMTNPNLPLERGGTANKNPGEVIQSNIQSNSISTPIQVGDLRHDIDFYWRACVTGNEGNTRDCTAPWRFRVNQGPAAVGETGNSVVPNTNTNVPVGSQPGSPGVNYKCSQLGSRLTDPEADPSQVRPYYTVSWTDGYGVNTVYSHVVTQQTSDSETWSNWELDKGPGDPGYNYGYKADGSSFTSDEVSPRQWRRGSSLASLTAAEQKMSMTEFLQTKVPDGVNVTWTARGEDRYGAADLTDTTPPLPFTLWNNSSPFTVANNAGPALDQQSPLINRRLGLPITTTFHKNSPPNFSTASTKKFKDLTGGTVTTVTDGQTVRVETTFENGGETPAKFYALRDYLGSLRDFERPSDITIRKNDGTTITLPTDEVLTRVIPDQQPIDNGPASQNDALNDAHDQVLPGEVDPESADYVRASWRIDLGDNQDGPLADPAVGGAGNVMNPGDTITLTYQVRANRNQQLLSGDPDNDFGRQLYPSDTHAWAYYQENYCDDADRAGKPINKLPGTVKAPWLRAQRGSVASNGGVFGYDALNGQANATFLVQANGILSHFTSATGATVQNYVSQQAVCTEDSGLPNTGERPGGVDWRRTMITNITKLLADSHHGTAETKTAFQSSGGEVTLNPEGESNVWVVGSPDDPAVGLTLDHSESFKGVGTLVVFGDLTIGPNVSLTYQADDGSINSLGVIVIGNVSIDPSVTNLVGNYYVLDSKVELDDEGCPVGIDEFKEDYGRVSTGASANRLNVQGLMVAGAFDMLRYYIDPSDSAADPAENFYYDGRVLANTPPGFGTFRNVASWQEIAP